MGKGLEVRCVVCVNNGNSSQKAKKGHILTLINHHKMLLSIERGLLSIKSRVIMRKNYTCR